eukprot:PhM_4_TR19068/c0_g1_i1/m.54231/K14379/ACP5; tartrate-resistant acid phosphatase type 5
MSLFPLLLKNNARFNSLFAIVIFVLYLSPVVIATPEETLALHQFYIATDGPMSWPGNWKGGDWEHGVSDVCNRGGRWIGTWCDYKEGRVIYVHHRSNHARGTLPSSLKALSAIHWFDCSYNKIGGTLPELGTWTVVQGIIFSHNKLTGTVPESYGSLPSLRFLLLDGNQLHGTLPASLFRDGSNLEGLFLSGNSFSGTLPVDVTRLPRLTHLRLHDNPQLSGDITRWELPKLVLLEAHNTQISADSAASPSLRRSMCHTLRAGEPFDSATLSCGPRSAPMRFMLMGDFGTGGQFTAAAREISSAQVFNEFAQAADSNFTISVGDNFYTDSSNLDLFIRESFEALFTEPALMRPWYAAFGNHDSGHQLSYTRRSLRWYQPATFFNISRIPIPGSAHTFDVIFVDTASRHLPSQEWAWLKAQLNASTARRDSGENKYVLLVTHYPLVSSGCHRVMRTAHYLNNVLKDYPNLITAYIAGHDHHLEIGEKEGMFHIMVGGFARGPCVRAGSANTFWLERVAGGFAYATMDPYVMNVTFVSENGVVMHHAVIPSDWRVNWQQKKEKQTGVATINTTLAGSQMVVPYFTPDDMPHVVLKSTQTTQQRDGVTTTATATNGAGLPQVHVACNDTVTILKVSGLTEDAQLRGQPFGNCGKENVLFTTSVVLSDPATHRVVVPDSVSQKRAVFFACVETKSKPGVWTLIPTTLASCASGGNREDAFGSGGQPASQKSAASTLTSIAVIVGVMVVGVVVASRAIHQK